MKQVTKNANANNSQQQLLEKINSCATQKEKVALLADNGFNINEIVEITNIKKINVSWYWSKLGLSSKYPNRNRATSNKPVELSVLSKVIENRDKTAVEDEPKSKAVKPTVKADKTTRPTKAVKSTTKAVKLSSLKTK